MKIVIVAPRFPYPLEKGDKLRLFHQIKYLSEKHEIYLISLSSKIITYGAIKPVEAFCQNITILKLRSDQKIKNLLLSFFSQKPLQVAYYYQSWIKEEIDIKIAEIKPDLVYFQLYRTAPYASGIKEPKVLDIMDSFRLVAERNAAKSNLLYKLIYRREARLIQTFQNKMIPQFKQTVIISKVDQTDVFQGSSMKPSHIVRNGIDTLKFVSKKKPKIYDLSFVGNLGYRPNQQALQYILKQLFPKLKAVHPKLSLLIAGARTTENLQSKNIEGIHFAGWMDQIQDAYDSSKIFVAPLFTGSGLQNKILEAMAMGVPCVTTSLVNDSIGAIPDQQILIADDIDQFVEKISLLLHDRNVYQQIKKEALIFVKASFSWEKEVQNLSTIFENAIEEGNS